MVSRSRLKSVLTGLALYTIAAAMVGYFGVNAYTGKYGLNARQELDQEIVALTSELARLKRERTEGEQRVSLLRCPTGSIPTCSTSARASSSIMPIRTIWFGSIPRTDPSESRKFQKAAKSISKMSRHIALRHSEFFAASRNPSTAV